MTIFEQTIDTSQVQMESSFLGITIIALICYVITISSIYFYEKILDYEFDYELLEKISNLKVKIIIFMISGISVFIVGVIFTFTMPFYLPPPIKALSEPVYGESRDHGVRNSSKESIADTYRDEIDKSIKDKLGDYEIPEYSIDNPQESILGGGYLEKKISAVRDGKTYTLTPEWSYDKDTSTVRLDVDIEEGYRIEN